MVWRVVALLVVLAGGALGQGFSALARLDAGASRVEDEGSALVVELALDRAVPWRLRTWDGPPRLVVELDRAEWGDLGGVLRPGLATGLLAEEGASRLVVALAAPLAVEEAGLRVDEASGGAVLSVRLAPTDAATFAALAESPGGARAPGAVAAPPEPAGRLVVAVDPGHGGADPGAEREGLREAPLMLSLGLELSESLARAGLVPVMTRTEDVFVPLGERMTVARAAGADVLVSLHADALEEDQARGASVYVLADALSGGASERVVARHDPSDLVAGLDLTGADDAVATALMDLARADTAPASRRLAEGIAEGLRAAGAGVNRLAVREAPLAVLGAADFPSVLLETGFLSDEGDRARLSSPEGRGAIVAGVVAALLAWEADEAARAGLRRR